MDKPPTARPQPGGSTVKSGEPTLPAKRFVATSTAASAASDPSLAAAMSALDTALGRRDLPKEFSDDGLATLLQRQTEYLEDLGIEAIRLARLAKADVVSASHVEDADQNLRPPQRRVALMEAGGGVFAGAGVGQSLAVMMADKPTDLAIAAAIVLSVVGFVLLAFGLARR